MQQHHERGWDPSRRERVRCVRWTARNPIRLEGEGGPQITGDSSEKMLERWGRAECEGLSDNRGPWQAFSRLGVPGPVSLKMKD